jgi:pyruvate kinase
MRGDISGCGQSTPITAGTTDALLTIEEISVTSQTLQYVTHELSTIRSEMLALEKRYLASIDTLPEARRVSARNLVHYLALRRGDRRALQEHLAACGLSSLGRAEAQVLQNVDSVLGLLSGVDGVATGHGPDEGRALLRAQTDELLGPAPAGRDVRIMVTMPGQAAHDFALVRELVTAGVDCMRVNCAHDDRETWSGILRHLTRANLDTGKHCRALLDLAGPKLRTGPIQSGPPVIRWRPTRDVYGRAVRPARIWLTDAVHLAAAPEPGAPTLSIDAGWLNSVSIGERVTLRDARDARRELTIVSRASGGMWAESEQTAYIVPGTKLRRARHSPGPRTAYVGDLPPTVQPLVLAAGDTLMLTRALEPGRAAVRRDDGTVLQPASIGLTVPEVFDDIRSGEAIWFDDGRIGGLVSAVTPERIDVTITRADPAGSKLLPDKGVNLPDTRLRLPSLTAKDLDDLPYVAAHADIVGYSFVRTADDVRELQTRLASLGRPGLPLILKIETRRAFEQLPALLLAAMHSSAAGVMIARGDLAVECGYERLAEIQEEILWMAEASHMPVIWATQVLEGLAKKGIPTRAEVTDAAMGERAECVMLNKGPYILEAVRALDNILTRMQTHQRKKTSMLRQLRIAGCGFDAVSSQHG